MATLSLNALERNVLERDIYDACAKSAAGADLLISAFVAALRSYRRASVCAPFPGFLMDNLRNKDFKSATESVSHFPPTEAVASIEFDNCEGAVNPLQNIPLQALTLLHWILHFRCQVDLVSDLDEISDLCLPNRPRQPSKQDLTLNRYIPPVQVLKLQHVHEHTGEKLFQTAKTKHGSIMAFHGTTTENLHCILRCGLLNMSNSHLQRHGAVFGAGVYLSTDLAVAASFSKIGDTWEGSCIGSKVMYILLCEVAKGDGVIFPTASEERRRKLDRPNTNFHEIVPVEAHGTYVVVKTSNLLRIRCVLVYQDKVMATSQGGFPLAHTNCKLSWLDRIRRNRYLVDLFSLSIMLYMGLLVIIALK